MRRQQIKALNKTMKHQLAMIRNWQLPCTQKEGIMNKDGCWPGFYIKDSRTEDTVKSQCLNFQRETKIDFKDGVVLEIGG